MKVQKLKPLQIPVVVLAIKFLRQFYPDHLIRVPDGGNAAWSYYPIKPLMHQRNNLSIKLGV